MRADQSIMLAVSASLVSMHGAGAVDRIEQHRARASERSDGDALLFWTDSLTEARRLLTFPLAKPRTRATSVVW